MLNRSFHLQSPAHTDAELAVLRESPFHKPTNCLRARYFRQMSSNPTIEGLYKIWLNADPNKFPFARWRRASPFPRYHGLTVHRKSVLSRLSRAAKVFAPL